MFELKLFEFAITGESFNIVYVFFFSL